MDPWFREWRGSKVGVGGVIVPTEFNKLFFVIPNLFSGSFMKIKLTMGCIFRFIFKVVLPRLYFNVW